MVDIESPSHRYVDDASYTDDHTDSCKQGGLSCFQVQLAVFKFFERPTASWAIGYHVLVLLLILVSVVLSVLSTTVEGVKLNQESNIYVFEMFLSSYFALEFIIRFATCGVIYRYRGCRGKARFLISIYVLIDLFIVIVAFLEFFDYVANGFFKFLRFARFFQIFRVYRMGHRNQDLHIMWHTVCEHKKELITCYFICFNILFVGAYVIYMVEKPAASTVKDGDRERRNVEDTSRNDTHINDMVNGLYWGVITFTSVGFGDYTPQTWMGKILTAIFSVIGCAFFSLPAGIIGSGFALQVSKQKKAQQYSKVRNPAAIVIQTAWRNFAINENNILQATWFYLLPQLSTTAAPNHKSGSSVELSGLSSTETLDNLGRNGNYTRQRNTQDEDAMRKKSVLNFFAKHKREGIAATPHTLSVDVVSVNGSHYSNSSLLGYCDVLEGVPEMQIGSIPIGNIILKRYQHAVRFVQRLKFKAVVSSFRNVRQPHVNVEHILMKNNLHSVEALNHLKVLIAQMGKLHNDVKNVKQELKQLRAEVT